MRRKKTFKSSFSSSRCLKRCQLVRLKLCLLVGSPEDVFKCNLNSCFRTIARTFQLLRVFYPKIRARASSLTSVCRLRDRDGASFPTSTSTSTPSLLPLRRRRRRCSPRPGVDGAARSAALRPIELKYPEATATAPTYRTGFLGFGSVSHLNKQWRRWRRVNGVKKKLSTRPQRDVHEVSSRSGEGGGGG